MAENKGLATQPGQLVQFAGIQLTAEQFRTIEHTIAPGLDTDEMELFFYECKRRGVHPMDRLIFPIKRNDNTEGGAGQKKLTFQCSIDLFRAQSEDTGRYIGQDPVEFGPMIPLSKASPKTGAGHDDLMVPEYATVTLLRRNEEDGLVVKIPATAYWSEYYPGEKMGFMWRKMPRGQLAKCAEALAHRKAFPRELGGLYANEEVERVDADIPFAKASTVKALATSSASTRQSQEQTSRPSGIQKETSTPASQEPLPGVAVEIPSEIRDLSHVKQSLYSEIVMEAGSIEKGVILLRELSEFTGTDGKPKFIDLHRLQIASDQWCGTALGKLRDQIKKR